MRSRCRTSAWDSELRLKLELPWRASPLGRHGLVTAASRCRCSCCWFELSHCLLSRYCAYDYPTHLLPDTDHPPDSSVPIPPEIQIPDPDRTRRTTLVDRPSRVASIFPPPPFFLSSLFLLLLVLISCHVLLGPSEPDHSGPDRLAPRHGCLVDATTGHSFNCKAHSLCRPRYSSCLLVCYPAHNIYLLFLLRRRFLHAVDRLLAIPLRGP